MDFSLIIKFFFVPLIVSGIMYVLVHFQLLFFHKLLKMDISPRFSKKICFATALSSFVAAIILLLIDDYLRLHLNSGGV
ncbi:hypothetical protein GF345_01860 [Candidatus Woesearchaeota archaeon]|nr:hypothetical protein [Candidatus Woesearchaeota archaeon]